MTKATIYYNADILGGLFWRPFHVLRHNLGFGRHRRVAVVSGGHLGGTNMLQCIAHI